MHALTSKTQTGIELTSPLPINLLSGISDLSSRIRNRLLIRSTLFGFLNTFLPATYELFDYFDRRRRTARLASEYFSTLVDDEDTPGCAFTFLQANGSDQRCSSVTQ